MKLRSLPFALVIAVILVNCSSSYLTVPVTKPARINLIGINKIAIGEIVGNGANDLSDELTTMLFNSGRYEVLDRQHLNRIFEEHRLAYSGAIDDNTAIQLGQLLGSAALIFGRLSQHEYNEETTSSDWKDDKGGSHTSHTRTGKARVTVAFQITDLRTGKLIAVKNLPIEVKKETRNTDATPDRIDAAALLRDARKRILTTFMKDIAPYTVNERVTLLSDKKIPQLAQGIGMAKYGNWEKAIEYFRMATEAMPTSSKAFFNLGVANEWTYNFTEAINNLEKAYELEPKSEYLKELSRCQQFSADYQKLQQQLQQAGN